MKKLLLAFTLVSCGSINLIHSNPRVPITVQNQLDAEQPQRWKELSFLGKTRVNTATAILIPFAVGYITSALFAPEGITNALEKVFGPVVKRIENQTKY